MRLFIAVRFDENVVRALTAAQNALRARDFSGQYTKEQNLHMTLAFIGEYSDPEHVLHIMRDTMSGNTLSGTFPLKLSKRIGNFGDLLWAGAEHTEALMGFSGRLRDALDRGGVPHDKLPFIPHITLLQRARSNETFEDIVISQETMTVKGITLLRSDISRDDRGIYREVGSAGI